MRVLTLLLLLFSGPVGSQDFEIAPNDWVLGLEEKGIQIFESQKDYKGLIPFKAVARISAPLPKILNILLDTERKPEWAPKLEKVKLHVKKSSRNYIFSEYYKTPWPAKDREFLLDGSLHFSENSVLFSAKSHIDPLLKSKDHIQADVKILNVKLTKISEEITLMEFTFLGHMKGLMPKWLVNIIQRKWPLRFIEGLISQLKKENQAISPLYLELQQKGLLR